MNKFSRELPAGARSVDEITGGRRLRRMRKADWSRRLVRENRLTVDDLIWPQLALHSMQMTVMSAAQQAVEAPIAVPQDVHEVPVGPGAIIPANDPNSIHRVSLDVPAAAFATVAFLCAIAIRRPA